MRALMILTVATLATTAALGFNAVRDMDVPAYQEQSQPIMLAQVTVEQDAAAEVEAEAAPKSNPASKQDSEPAPAPATAPVPAALPAATPAPGQEPASNSAADPQPATATAPAPSPASPPAQATEPQWTSLSDAEAMGAADRYLKTLTSLRARFQQISPDGLIMTGTAYLKKPGRARFDYDDPSPLTIIADGFWVALIDTEGGTQDRYPLNATPLAMLLTDKGNLSDVAQLSQLEQGENLLRLHLQSKEEAGLGTLILSFSRDPFALTQWTVIDAQGYRTRILLSDIEHGAMLNPSLFRIETMLDDGNPRR